MIGANFLLRCSGLFLMRLTMSEAVRSRSLRSRRSSGGSYVDQTTWRDFASTRKIVPLPRPNEEFSAGLSSLFTVSAMEARGVEPRPCVVFRPCLRLRRPASRLRLGGSGGGYRFVQLRLEALADLVGENGVGQFGVGDHLEDVLAGQPVGQVLVQAAAPSADRYTLRTLERSAAQSSAPEQPRTEHKPLHTIHDIQTRPAAEKDGPHV